MTSLLQSNAPARPINLSARDLAPAPVPRIAQGVVLAAGAGSRLRTCEADLPKPLTPVAGVSLLERAIRTFRDAGVSEVIVVVGYQYQALLPILADLRVGLGIRVTPAISSRWELGNGASLLAAERYVKQPFFLAMCDHIFEPAFLDRLVAADDGKRACALVVDRAAGERSTWTKRRRCG